jgi:RNA polymerase sigma-70 factor (ECF subfamily)
MDEQMWIKQILAGDTLCFSRLVAKYQVTAFHIAYRILDNREEAEEAVQDSFVRAYRALPDFQFGSKFSTWFYRIVYNTSLTAQHRQSFPAGYNDDACYEPVTNDETDNALAVLEREDRKEIIRLVLQKLPQDEALLLTLYYLEESSVEDIHQITGLTLSNIKIKLFRGRKRFYEKLKSIMKHEIQSII